MHTFTASQIKRAKSQFYLVGSLCGFFVPYNMDWFRDGKYFKSVLKRLAAIERIYDGLSVSKVIDWFMRLFRGNTEREKIRQCFRAYNLWGH